MTDCPVPDWSPWSAYRAGFEFGLRAARHGQQTAAPDRSKAELFDEIRRAHAEADRWRRCALRWRSKFLEAERQLGVALGGKECG